MGCSKAWICGESGLGVHDAQAWKECGRQPGSKMRATRWAKFSGLLFPARGMRPATFFSHSHHTTPDTTLPPNFPLYVLEGLASTKVSQDHLLHGLAQDHDALISLWRRPRGFYCWYVYVCPVPLSFSPRLYLAQRLLLIMSSLSLSSFQAQLRSASQPHEHICGARWHLRRGLMVTELFLCLGFELKNPRRFLWGEAARSGVYCTGREVLVMSRTQVSAKMNMLWLT